LITYFGFLATISQQLQLALVARNRDENSEEPLEHPNQISVEIMRENLSLLESIAAVDDPSSEVLYPSAVYSMKG